MEDMKNTELKKIMGDKDIGEFLGILVHELKTGMSVISGSSSLLEFENPQLVGNRRIRDIELFCRYISGVLDGFHYISRISRGYEEEKDKSSLSVIIEDVVELVGSLSGDKKIIHEIVESQEIEGNEVLWRELVFGLVLNGVCHGRGDVSIKEGDEGLVFAVENLGSLEENDGLINGQVALGIDRGSGISKILAGALGREIVWASLPSEVEGSSLVRVEVR